MRRWTIINAILGLLVALLAVEIAGTWARALPPVEVSPRAPAPPAEGEKRPKGKRGGAENRGEVLPPAMVAAISQKDLFDPSRQAATEEVAAPVAKAPEPPPNVTVVGVRIFGRDSEVFVVDASQGNQQRRLRIGDQVGGYTVKAIDATGLTLASPSGDEVSMALAIEKGKTPPARTSSPTGRPPAHVPPPSPAAGPQGTSPAAGVPVKPPPPAQSLMPKPTPGQPQPTPAVTPPATGQPPPPGANLPADVQQKLEQLRHREPRSRAGRTQ